MSNDMNDKELRDFGELAKKLLEVENSRDVNCGWFKVSNVDQGSSNLIWVHKFGATIFLYDAETRDLNRTYAAEAWTAYRYLQKRLVLDRIVDGS